MGPSLRPRTGGHLVVESLEALGVTEVFGLPGIHALPIWEALRTSTIRTLGFRTELNAGFAAGGAAAVTGRPAVLVVSTGPGALNCLTAAMEAASSFLPLVIIASQVPRDLIGRGRGYLHDLADQQASFSPVVKWTARADDAASLSALIGEAWLRAAAVPSGPVFLEIPADVLSGPAPAVVGGGATGVGALQTPPARDLRAAARLLSTQRDPVIWAGGGVIRSGAWPELVALAEKLDAPVVTTYMGKGAIPPRHPLAAGSACDDAALQELLADAGAVLCAGTELGAETTGQYRLRFSGRLVQIDADPGRVGATYPALSLVGDAAATMRALLPLVADRRRPDPGPAGGAARAGRVRDRVRRGLEAQDRGLELGLLRAIESSVPADAVTAWDMTILGYWAAAHQPAPAPRRFLYPLGSGTLGFAWPAALGASAVLPGTPALAVVGDGGFLYGLGELLTANQHRLAAKLLLVDDGGYGILREYQRDGHRELHGVDLVQADFPALIAACGVAVRTTAPERLKDDLEWALGVQGPAALVLRERLRSHIPTT